MTVYTHIDIIINAMLSKLFFIIYSRLVYGLAFLSVFSFYYFTQLNFIGKIDILSGTKSIYFWLTLG